MKHKLVDLGLIGLIAAVALGDGYRGAMTSADGGAAGGFIYLVVLALGLLAVSVAQLGTAWKGRTTAGSSAEEAAGGASQPVDHEARQRVMLAVGLLTAHVLLLPVAGFLIASILFFTAFLRFFGKSGWIASLGFGVVGSGAFYLVFTQVASTTLPRGPLGL